MTTVDTKDYDKTYMVRLTEKEMQTIANCMSAHFEHMTRNKRILPPETANHVFTALDKMKKACEGKAVLVVAH